MAQTPAALLREARHRSGLSQRALGELAATTQSVIARIELGMSIPSWSTLERLVTAAGFTLESRLAPIGAERSHMLADVTRILSLTPEERLTEVANLSGFLASAVRRG